MGQHLKRLKFEIPAMTKMNQALANGFEAWTSNKK
jgi:hypothetical protein